LGRRFGYVDPSVVRIHRLEAHRIVTRCALTPTDVFHASGAYTVWDKAASTRALSALAAWMHTDLDELVRRVHAELANLAAEHLLERVLERQAPSEDGRVPGAVGRLLWDAVVGRRSIGRLTLAPQLDRPVVGIGAPVRQFAPQAAKQLGARAVVPEHAEVANAVGAAASQVVVQQQVSISPNADGFYDLSTDTGVRTFADLEDAERFAREFLTERIRAHAAEAGARTRQVTLSADARWAPLADGSDQLVRLVVEGVLAGHPLETTP
jgi:N-methylhydantoinase A/oxoprolinase/acetone carboxylase beta subunit